MLEGAGDVHYFDLLRVWRRRTVAKRFLSRGEQPLGDEAIEAADDEGEAKADGIVPLPRQRSGC